MVLLILGGIKQDEKKIESLVYLNISVSYIVKKNYTSSS